MKKIAPPAGAKERQERIAELRREESDLNAALAKLSSGSTAVGLAMRDARSRELAAVVAKLSAFGETPMAAVR
ncbi:hypothetical protein [Cupriavidus numazuensis]|uniref:hypothetical protein n=1 Tax=Cupriavidus numazuensis TaxID=221992 RepID=UPI001BAE3BC3|nr:hypothetical protein [Cupriavidus numazuensis]